MYLLQTQPTFLSLDLHRAECGQINDYSSSSFSADTAAALPGGDDVDDDASDLRVCSICQSLIYKGGFEAHLKLHETSLKVTNFIYFF